MLGARRQPRRHGLAADRRVATVGGACGRERQVEWSLLGRCTRRGREGHEHGWLLVTEQRLARNGSDASRARLHRRTTATTAALVGQPGPERRLALESVRPRGELRVRVRRHHALGRRHGRRRHAWYRPGQSLRNGHLRVRAVGGWELPRGAEALLARRGAGAVPTPHPRRARGELAQ